MPKIPSRPERYIIRIPQIRALSGPTPDLNAVAREIEDLMTSSAPLAATGSPAATPPVIERLERTGEGLHALSALLDDDAYNALQARHRNSLLIERDDELLPQDQFATLHDTRTLPPENHFQTVKGTDFRFKVTDAAHQPVARVLVELVGSRRSARDVSDARGQVTLTLFSETPETLRRLIVKPPDRFWGIDVERPALTPAPVGDNPIVLDPLEDLDRQVSTWGLQIMGLDHAPAQPATHPVRVAIIDSGLSAQHPDLEAAGGHDFNAGADPAKTWKQDDSGHGTHVSGVCGALNNQIGIVGAAAPGVQIFGLKVFPDARVSKLVRALDWCIDNRVDIVNLSLGTTAFNQTFQEAVARARSAGLVLVAAAGNSSGDVLYPARFNEVVAVAALGKADAFPATSPHRHYIGPHQSGNLFVADFTCTGDEIDFIAPGVAVVSTVPGGSYAAWDGTSMACPFITGFLARLLQTDPHLASLPRDASRVSRLVDRAKSLARYLDFPPTTQGAGLPVWPANASPEPHPDSETKREILRHLDRVLFLLDQRLGESPDPARLST
ncbi:MAG: S8 family peptidase [Verrucomicrobiae bacterium]|nr:S8 family peptidase [Verrucomicrobiae bacterium]